jgi:hypothetical protein
VKPCWRQGGEEVQLLLILDLGTNGRVSGQHHALAALYPRERIPGTNYIGGWVHLRAGLDTEVWGKILCLCRGSKPGSLVCTA